MIDWLSAIFLLITGLAALYVGIVLLKEYMEKKSLGHLMWAIAFFVLLVSGLLLIIFDFAVLDKAIVPPVVALIPVGMAAGLMFLLYEDKPVIGYAFLAYELIMIVVTAVVRLGGYEETPGLIMAIHIPAAFAIVGLPFITGEDKAWMFSIGGTLISFGGILLAFLKLSEPLFGVFTADVIFVILPPLLLVVAVLFTLGMIYPEKWRINTILNDKLLPRVDNIQI
jgi:hypothetical protein